MTRAEIVQRRIARVQRWHRQRTEASNGWRTSLVPDRITSVEQADVIMEAYFQLGDPNLFARHLDAMGGGRFRSSIAGMLVTGTFISNYDEFAALLRHCGVISLAQLARYNIRYQEMSSTEWHRPGPLSQ